MIRRRFALIFLMIAMIALGATGASAQITLVNMVPQARSGETNQDSEPSIAVNPANPLQLAGSAFTWDNLNGGAFSMLGNLAPIYVSTDGGATWSAVLSVPSTAGAQFPTGDINPRFTAAPSGSTSMLYTGILHSSDFNMWVLRATDYRLAVAMAQIDTRTNNVDQPHLGGLMSLFGDAGADHVYVGFNNGYGGVNPSGHTASVDWTLNGGAGAPTFNLNAIETRSTGTLKQDGFSTVPTVHPDGTVYVGFYGWRSSGGGGIINSDVVVVRDDHFGNDNYGSLLGAGGFAGVQVVTAQPMQNGGSMGQNRLGASNMAISVDPNNSSRVYLVWGDQPAMTTNQTLHVRVSTNRGATWGSDLLTIPNAVNPAIAVNSHGVVGLLYQTWGSNRWQSIFRRTNNAAGTTFDAGVVLANTDSTTPSPVFQPYIGDYTGLVARGRDFYGIFSASNFPDTANFPTVAPTYQRFVNWGTHTLFANASLTTTVNPSIDPFFFHSVEVNPNADFYVRDWTDNAASGDDGAEPSTHSVFYATSDVWNRRGPTDGSPFVNDQPANEPAGNGLGNLGDNWAFARVRRNTTGTADTVTAHYAVSPFGTGSNFADGVTVLFPGLTMSGPDPSVSFLAGETGPKTMPNFPWHLDAIASSHLCLGVQISTATDPYLAPGIVGHTPGWGTGTDLEILNDNNKAQRNMGLSSTPSHGGPSAGSVSHIALIHNAATFTRDMKIRYEASRDVVERFGGNITIMVADGRREPFQSGATLTLPKMRPGENRWVKITLPASAVKEGEILPVYFHELKDGRVVNGFGVGIRGASNAVVIGEALSNHRGAFGRVAALYRSEAAKRAASSSDPVRDERQLLAYLKLHLADIDRALTDLDRVARDLFEARRHFGDVQTTAGKGDAMGAALALTSLANAVDSRVTAIELAKGNAADILQTLRWGRDLFSSPRLAKLSCATQLVHDSDNYERAFDLRKASLSGYVRLLAAQGQCLASGGKALGLDLATELRAIAKAGANYPTLQKAHSDLLLRISNAVER